MSRGRRWKPVGLLDLDNAADKEGMSLRNVSSSTTSIAALFEHHLASSSPFSILYASHPHWPLPPSSASTSTSHPPSRTPAIHLSVLDSSFNPPHLAHLALASHVASHAPPPTGHLLVLSTKNADKSPQPGEPSTAQRLEMMRAQALEMVRVRAMADGGANVAVACVSEPTFVGKSRLLSRELEELVRKQLDGLGRSSEPAPKVTLSFPLGWDTLIRFFSPRYYASMSDSLASFFTTDNSSILCARRGDIADSEQQAFLQSDDVRPWVTAGKLEMFDLPVEVRDISSTSIRAAAAGGDTSEQRRERWEKFVLPGVADVIEREGLFRA